ncbi:MAG: lasso RiPP family leader peptide-containing protein [Chloroflexota bacterium]
MKIYETPELVELGNAVELTLGGRPGTTADNNGTEYYVAPCGCACGNPDPIEQK